MHDDEIGVIALGDVEDLRSHLDPRRRHREGAQLEALRFLQGVEDRHRLLAGRVVVIDIGDLLAFEIAAELVLGELDRPSGLRPIGCGDREQIRKAGAVGGGGDAEAGRSRRHLVLLEPLVQGHGLRRAVERHHHDAHLLLPLIGLDRRRHLVLVVDLVAADHPAVDPALRIDQLVIILHRRAQHGADDLGRAGAVALVADQDLLGLGHRRRGQHQPGRGAGGEPRHAPR